MRPDAERLKDLRAALPTVAAAGPPRARWLAGELMLQLQLQPSEINSKEAIVEQCIQDSLQGLYLYYIIIYYCSSSSAHHGFSRLELERALVPLVIASEHLHSPTIRVSARIVKILQLKPSHCKLGTACIPPPEAVLAIPPLHVVGIHEVVPH